MNIFDNILEQTKVIHGDGFVSVSMYFSYIDKNKQKGDPVPKQSVRSTMLPRKNARCIIKTETIGGKPTNVRYYPMSDLYLSQYQPAIITNNVEHIQKQLIEIMKTNNIKKFEGPMIVENLAFVYSPLKSMPKKTIESIRTGNFIPRTTAPDLTDNLPKLLFDALEGILYDNDSKIFFIKNVVKCFGNNPGVFIQIKGKI
jgi:Holliday junction resolvase RusA-like endonuclease